MKSSGFPWVVYDLSGSDSGPVMLMLTESEPESPEHGLGKYVGNDGVEGPFQVLPETSSDPMPVSSTVAIA
jgi:hypothetical protein